MTSSKPTPQELLQDEKELADACKVVLKASRRLLDDRATLSGDQRLFSVELVRLGEMAKGFSANVRQKEKDSAPRSRDRSLEPAELRDTICTFADSLNTMADRRDRSRSRVESNAERNLQSLSIHDFRANDDALKKLNSASNELAEQGRKLGQFRKRGKDAQKLAQLNSEKERLEASLKQAQAEFDSQLLTLSEDRHVKMMMALEALITDEYEYFKRGWMIFRDLAPALKHLRSTLALHQAGSNVIKEGMYSYRLGKKWKEGKIVLTAESIQCFGDKDPQKPEIEMKTLLCSVKVEGTVRDAGGGSPAVGDAKSGGEKQQLVELEIDSPELQFSKKKRQGFILGFSSAGERAEWVQSIQGAIAIALEQPGQIPLMDKNMAVERSGSFSSTGSDGPEDERKLSPVEAARLLVAIPGNSTCADCSSADPEWASINLGILICMDCSGFHRSLGVHISKVRSLTLDRWEPCVLDLMGKIGNKRANKILLSGGTDGESISADSDREERGAYIKKKHDTKAFMAKRENYDANTELLHGIERNFFFDATANVKVREDAAFLHVYEALLRGANPTSVIPWSGLTALSRAAELDDSFMVELLLQFGANLLQRGGGQTAAHAAAAANARSALDTLLKDGKIDLDELRDDNGQLLDAVAIMNGSEDAIELLSQLRMGIVQTRTPVLMQGDERNSRNPSVSMDSVGKGRSDSRGKSHSRKRTSSSGPQLLSKRSGKEKRSSRDRKARTPPTSSSSLTAEVPDLEGHREKVTDSVSTQYGKFRIHIDGVVSVLGSGKMEHSQLLQTARMISSARVNLEEELPKLGIEVPPDTSMPPTLTESDDPHEMTANIGKMSTQRLVRLLGILVEQISQETTVEGIDKCSTLFFETVGKLISSA